MSTGGLSICSPIYWSAHSWSILTQVMRPQYQVAFPGVCAKSPTSQCLPSCVWRVAKQVWPQTQSAVKALLDCFSISPRCWRLRAGKAWFVRFRACCVSKCACRRAVILGRTPWCRCWPSGRECRSMLATNACSLLVILAVMLMQVTMYLKEQ